jgi:hypothetical protein
LKRKVIAVLLLFLSQIAVALVQQQQEAPRGRIEGTVLKAGTGEAIVGARVTLTRANQAGGPPGAGAGVISMAISASGPPPALPNQAPAAGARGAPPPSPPPPPPAPAIPAVTTDRDGKFVIPDLEAGSYRLLVVSNGYVRQEYGQRVFPGQGTNLTLTAGQVLKDLVFRLTLTGNVSGRLHDNFGQPAIGVPIQLLKASFGPSGERIFQLAGSMRTNDRGEYRLYWVTPGRYYVAAGNSAGPRGGPLNPAGAPVSPNDPGDNYVFTYFPGVTNIAAASVIDVVSGSEMGIDFPVAKQELYSIRGRVVDAATNRPPAFINVSLAFASVTGGGGVFSLNTPYNATTGAFEVRDIVPGSYSLSVTSGTTAARIPLDVTNNIDGLAVVLSGTFTIPGRIRLEGQLEPSGMDRVRVALRPVADSSFGAGATTRIINADGTFTLDNVAAGAYRITLNTFQGAPDYFIKEARFDRSDALNQPLVISDSVPGGASLDVVISPNVGQVDGVVMDAKLQPVAGVQAVLIPDQNRDRTELFKTGTTDQSGRFTIKGITPGDYKLFAWETLENFGYFDTELVKKSESLAKIVHVAESSKSDVEVKVIPAGQ